MQTLPFCEEEAPGGLRKRACSVSTLHLLVRARALSSVLGLGVKGIFRTTRFVEPNQAFEPRGVEPPLGEYSHTVRWMKTGPGDCRLDATANRSKTLSPASLTLASIALLAWLQ